MTNDRDVQVLREVARQVAEIAAKPIQNERRDLWRRHNSLRGTRPLLYVRWFGCYADALPESKLVCGDPFYRKYERALRFWVFQDRIGDDHVIEPWITVDPVHKLASPDGPWGLTGSRRRTGDKGGAWKDDYPLKDEADIDKLVVPRHEIDEGATARNASRLREAVGDILEVNSARTPLYVMWHADISTDLGLLRGIEPMMWDMSDRPAWLHRLCAFMRDGVLKVHREAEAAGDWRLTDHQNQAMPYSLELADPKPNGPRVTRKQLWGYAAAQEFAQVGPAMHDEFLLRYQIPILSEFGLTAYGCCENLTNKIGILRKIPNLRRIAVTPWADVRRCAERIGTDYVLSWRPSPAETICGGFDAERLRRILRDGLEAARGCHVDISLKDVQRVPDGFDSLVQWAQVAREVAEEFA